MTPTARPSIGNRAAGLLLALAVEAALVVMFLWWLAPFAEPERRVVPMATFDVAAPPPPEPDAEVAAVISPSRAPPATPPDTPPPPDPVAAPPEAAPEAPPPAIVPLTPDQMARFDIAAIPSATRGAPPPAPRSYGPPAPPRVADSEIVGTAPNGQPLYAASWYREPYPEELRGYLSTASGPGWGMIACRIVAGYRVTDCVGQGEYPGGSNIERSVLAAAWQFRVRPPTIGGKPQFGEWVRIRIDYGTRNGRPSYR